MPLLSGASLLLLINYWVSSGLILYLITTHLEFGLADTWLVAVTAPIVVLFFHLFSLGLSGWVTGESDVFKGPFAMKMIGAQFLGIVYFVCALVWVLKPEYVEFTLNIVLWAFIIESAFRILKSISLVLQQGVSWYYIILYFCTLEILPYLVFYHYVLRNLLK